MRRAFTVFRCQSCGRKAFPRRLACMRCGCSAWTKVEAAEGVVDATTTRMHRIYEERRVPIGDWSEREPVHLASVRTDAGPVITARVGPDVTRRDRVRLYWSSGAPVAERSGTTR